MEIHVAEGNYLLPARIWLAFAFVILLTPLCLTSDLASKRLSYNNWLSVALYVLWLIAIVFAHSQGTLETNAVVIPRGRLLQNTSNFVCSVSSKLLMICSNHSVCVCITLDVAVIPITGHLRSEVELDEKLQEE